MGGAGWGGGGGVVKLSVYLVNAQKIFNENILFYSELIILHSDINRT